jgi:hypothetical protein
MLSKPTWLLGYTDGWFWVLTWAIAVYEDLRASCVAGGTANGGGWKLAVCAVEYVGKGEIVLLSPKKFVDEECLMLGTQKGVAADLAQKGKACGRFPQTACTGPTHGD